MWGVPSPIRRATPSQDGGAREGGSDGGRCGIELGADYDTHRSYDLGLFCTEEDHKGGEAADGGEGDVMRRKIPTRNTHSLIPFCSLTRQGGQEGIYFAPSAGRGESKAQQLSCHLRDSWAQHRAAPLISVESPPSAAKRGSHPQWRSAQHVAIAIASCLDVALMPQRTGSGSVRHFVGTPALRARDLGRGQIPPQKIETCPTWQVFRSKSRL